ncbi:MAG: gephyrin-like molybdotransferase Glp [Candidatus Thermoplasmatota archaeon]
MKPFSKLISFEESKRLIENNTKAIKRIERISITQAVGRVIAEDIVANFDLPPFDRAAMDGYAVRAQDTFGAMQQKPKILKVVGSIEAGKTTSRRMDKGESIKIATGAKLPKGANSVVMVENTEEENSIVKIFKPVVPKENIGLKGEDIKKGSLVIGKNEILTPSKIGVIAGLGLKAIKVYCKPGIAIIPTGEEICEVGEKLKEGQVYDINTHTVSAIVEQNGGVAIKFEIVADNLKELKDVILKATDYEAVVVCGGSSVGSGDLLARVVQELGEIKFHGIQIKPGKPTLFGIVKNKPIFGLPGYPTSCLLNTYLLLLPALRKLARLPQKEERVVKAKLAKRVHGSLGRKFFLTVKLEEELAIPVFKESGAITSISEAQGYVEIPENVDVLEKGEEVEVKLF